MTEKELLRKINKLAQKTNREVTLMEVCGTQTEVIFKNAIRKVLPKNIKLVTGPGCPVCVTAQQDFDNIIKLSQENIPLAIFGDTLKVPGSFTSLEKMRSQGKDITIVYSPEECLKLKKKNLVFFAIGFETTAPSIAYIIKKGVSVYSSCKVFPHALSTLINSKKIKIDGLINPGHVSTIVGTQPYQKNNLPQVISGFTIKDILISITLLLKDILNNEKNLQNEYGRLVKEEGNLKALDLLSKVFKKEKAVWRGLGEIEKSGYSIKKEYEQFDAKKQYAHLFKRSKGNNNPCRCDKIILGLEFPQNCPFFKKVCSPDSPQGPCMVSSEGACNITYRYEQ